MLSSLAELIAQPSAQVVAELPVAEEIEVALSTGGGALGGLLAAVLAYERGDVAEAAEQLGLDSSNADSLVNTYLAAVGWSNRLVDDVLPIT
jgi:c-di-GMP-related signal transduction protein